MNEEFSNIKKAIEGDGYYSRYRDWSIGPSLMVGLNPQQTDSDISVIPRAFYIAKRDDGSFYTLVGGYDIGETLSDKEVIGYCLWVLKLNEQEYVKELSKRSSRLEN